MSCDGSATGRPSDGLSTLLDEIMSSRASSWLSNESGTCTAIWSPSKSALNAAHTSGWIRIAFAFHQHRLERLDAEAVQRRRAVQEHGVVLDDFLQDLEHLRAFLLHDLLGSLHRLGEPFSTSLGMMKGLNSSTAIAFGSPHWCHLSPGPTTIT